MQKKCCTTNNHIIHQDVVDSALNSMPKENTFINLANLFKLIGDTTRCKILFLLDKNEMCVCDIASALSMTKSAVSHQLANLRKNKIVKLRKSGKIVYYSLDDEHIVKLFEVGLIHIGEYNEKI